jgi:hypothetical protein
MPQVILLALAGVGAWLGYRWFQKEAQKVRENLAAAEDELRRREAAARERSVKDAGFDRDKIPKLELDPKTGVYRPKDSGND